MSLFWLILAKILLVLKVLGIIAACLAGAIFVVVVILIIMIGTSSDNLFR